VDMAREPLEDPEEGVDIIRDVRDEDLEDLQEPAEIKEDEDDVLMSTSP
jgi:hypothetical protein